MDGDSLLSQGEIDSLLSAAAQGDLEDPSSAAEDVDPAVVKYDLISQDRIIRGRMPALDIISDRFARQFRITLSNQLRKMVQLSVESTSLMKYAEFLNYLPIPSCLNIVRLGTLRGSSVVAMESKLIFAFLNCFFGGATNAQERVEGRDFTAIELMIIRKVVDLLLADLAMAWRPYFPIEGVYVRTEVNPQFLAIVPPTDVVVLTSYELELDNFRGTLQVVLPYRSIEPIRAHLTTNMQAGEAGDEEPSWTDQIAHHILELPVESRVQLGRAQITIAGLLDLAVGDVLLLDQSAADPLELQVEGSPKWDVAPVVKGGALAAQVLEPREVLIPGAPVQPQAMG